MGWHSSLKEKMAGQILFSEKKMTEWVFYPEEKNGMVKTSS